MALWHNRPAGPSPSQSDDSFTIHIVTLTRRTYNVSVTPRTTVRQLYDMICNEADYSPMEVQILVPSTHNRTDHMVSLPRVEDDGFLRPLSDFNMFQDMTLRLKLRLGRPHPAPYRREDWFPPRRRRYGPPREIRMITGYTAEQDREHHRMLYGDPDALTIIDDDTDDDTDVTFRF